MSTQDARTGKTRKLRPTRRVHKLLDGLLDVARILSKRDRLDDASIVDEDVDVIGLLRDNFEDRFDSFLGGDVSLDAEKEGRRRTTISLSASEDGQTGMATLHDELPPLSSESLLYLLKSLDSPSDSENGGSVRDERDGHVASESRSRSGDHNGFASDVEKRLDRLLREGRHVEEAEVGSEGCMGDGLRRSDRILKLGMDQSATLSSALRTVKSCPTVQSLMPVDIEELPVTFIRGRSR